MRYGVGIDLGTSFVSAAISGPGGTRMVPLSPQLVVPSVAYATPDGSLLTGTAALNAAAQHAGSETTERGQVARHFKRRLGDPTPLVLSGTAYSPAALMAAQLRAVLAHVTRTEGGPPDSVMLTCPAIWGPYRREHFAEVPRLAGVRDSQLVTEPEAAATHYSVERRLGDGEVVAVYDLGGGTLDTTILRMRSGGMEILGTPEGIEHMGGIDFDETLLAHVDDRLDGAISQLDVTDPALAEIRAMCVRAKEELSIEPDVLLTVPLPSGPREVMVTRIQFNELIRPSLQLTIDALRRTIASASLRTEDLSAVLLAGGSSRIPLVLQMVSKETGKPVRATLHPKFTVALGAAAIGARAVAATPPGVVPQQVAPVTPPGGVQALPATPPVRTKKWLVPAIATVAAVLVATVMTIIFTASGGDAGQTRTAPSPLRLYENGGSVAPYQGWIGSEENWSGTSFGADGARHAWIAAAPESAGGLRVTWTGGAPGQVYLQKPIPEDQTSYVDSAGALVFTTVVHKAAAERVAVAVHCVFPCGGEVEATTLFRELPVGQQTTIKIPLSCFVAKGLKPASVNTAFLVYTAGAFDATFSGIRWVPGAANDSDATSCDALT
jgi:molecular chaperone DnaK